MNNTTKIMKSIMSSSELIEVAPRGLKVKELLNTQVEIDPINCIPTFDSLPFDFRYFFGEMMWYINGSYDINFISKFSTFWKKLTDENDKINSNYGRILLEGKSLTYVLNELKNDKFTRKAVAFINEPKYYDKNQKDFPCTLNLLFYIRDNKLNIRVNMRSQDIFYGLQYDVPFFSLILQNIRLLLLSTYPDLELGKVIHTMDNVHFYERHYDTVENILKEKITSNYSITLNRPIFTLIDNVFEIDSKLSKLYDEINVDNYKPKDEHISSFYDKLRNLSLFDIKLH